MPIANRTPKPEVDARRVVGDPYGGRTEATLRALSPSRACFRTWRVV